MYHKIDFDRLSTRYDDSPVVTFRSEADVTSVEVDFCSSHIDNDGLAWRTTLGFRRVLDFRFFNFELGLRPPNDDDIAFALIEIEGSATLEQFASTRSVERTSMPILQVSDLHHYRIAFDEHGVYDAISTGLEVRYRRASSSVG